MKRCQFREKNAVTSCERDSEKWKPCSDLCATQQRFNGAFKCNRGSKKYVIWRTESLSSSDQEVWAQTCCHHCSKLTRCKISTGFIWHVHLCSTWLVSVAVQTLGRSSCPAHSLWVWTETWHNKNKAQFLWNTIKIDSTPPQGTCELPNQCIQLPWHCA